MPISGRATTVRGTSLRSLSRTALAGLARRAAAMRAVESAVRPGGGATRGGTVRPDGGRPRGGALTQLLVPLVGLGLVIGGVMMVTQKSRTPWTVSQVVQELRRVALEGGEASDPMAGSLGPLRIAARSIDAGTGDFIDFRIESERMIVTAERAVLDVDPDRDTFAFDLHGVVFTRIPDEGESGGSDEAVATEDGAEAPLRFGAPEPAPSEIRSLVHTTDRHLFGPADFGRDIVPDAGGRFGGGAFAPRGATAGSGRTVPGTPGAIGDGSSWLRDAGD